MSENKCIHRSKLALFKYGTKTNMHFRSAVLLAAVNPLTHNR